VTERRRANDVRVARAAADLITQCRIESLPVDVEAIAKRLEIQVEDADLPADFFGATASDGVSMRILVSHRCPTRTHRRFTICHEIGHCCIDGHAQALFERERLHMSVGGIGAPKEPVEVEADSFAAMLLMPETLIAPVMAKYHPSLDMVRAVAAAADVSLIAAALRCTELVADPFAIAVSERGLIEWVSFSSGLHEYHWTRRKWKGEAVPTDSATMTLAKSRARVAAAEVEVADMGLTDWFSGAPPVRVDEEAIGLGSYGRILTILRPGTLPTADQVEHAERRARETKGDWRDTMRPYHWDDPDDPD